jgi:hypothetical protein
MNTEFKVCPYRDMGENSKLSDGNKTPALSVRDGVLSWNVRKVEVLQESGKKTKGKYGEMDNVCSRQTYGTSEFLSEKAREQDGNLKVPQR